jgi:hypothetical protein
MDDSRASDYGLMKIDGKGRINYFNEKPKGDDLQSMVSALAPLFLLRDFLFLFASGLILLLVDFLFLLPASGYERAGALGW